MTSESTGRTHTGWPARLDQARLHFVTGKGGTGKTTVAAALALALAACGDDNVYYNCPCLFMPNEFDEGRLRMLQRLDIIMAVGREDPNFDNNRWFSEMLWGKGVWNALRIWDGWAHDWPWWHQMIQLYVSGAN